jgi:hypothetical protein
MLGANTWTWKTLSSLQLVLFYQLGLQATSM